MIRAFDYFDAIYCINLAHRVDRWERVQKEFDKMGIRDRLIRFNAIETPDNGAVGCMISHRTIVQKAKDMGWKNVLVFEDDVLINSDKSLFDGFITSLQKYSWDMLYFGGDVMNLDIPYLQRLNGNMYRCIGIRGTFAIGYNNSVFDKILKAFPSEKNEATVFIKKHIAHDLYLSRYFQRDIMNVMYHQILAVQIPDYSDIGHTFIDRSTVNVDNSYFWKVINSKKSLSNFIFYFQTSLRKVVAFYKFILSFLKF